MTLEERGVGMDRYENPNLDVIALQSEDIIRTSGGPDIDEGEVGI